MADKLPSDWTLDDYQYQARKSAVYPKEGLAMGISYVTLGLAGEAGEFANQVKKVLRDDAGKLTADRRAKLILELGDVLWYCAMAADELEIDLGNVAAQNIKKLQTRTEKGTLQGSGEGR
jgi:NTP pyrophosphatase (non-canonical NTP hydrolase)